MLPAISAKRLVILVAAVLVATANAFTIRPLSSTTRVTTKQQQQEQLQQPLYLFGFGNGEDDDTRFTKEIFRMDKVSSSSHGLAEYVKEWSTLLESEKLTTPIQVVKKDNAADGSGDAVVQILFKPRPGTGKYYQSSKDEKSEATSSSKSKAKADKQAEEQGGVEILVTTEATGGGTVSVAARRFNYGEDATIKEMSEETIVGKLKEALNVWKKEHSNI